MIERLDKSEQMFHKKLLDMSTREFEDMMFGCDEQMYESLINMIRKFKILGVRIPSYLGNLLEHEYKLAQRSTKAQMVGTLLDSVNKLSDQEERKLALIHFRGQVQYVTHNN